MADLKITPLKSKKILYRIFSLLLGVFGILMGIYWPSIFNTLLDNALVLRPNSRIFDMWKSPPLELTLDMYLFNWTNPEDFRKPHIKPKFEELGPYRFIDKPDKVDISWYPENATVSYRRKNEFFFDAAGSKGTLEDQITTINLLAMAIASKTKYWSPMRRTLIDMATMNVYHNEMSTRKTANELMFGGFDDVLLNMANFIPSSITEIIVPFDKFGYCYSRNGSSQFSGLFNIHTGADNLRKLGQMHTWNHRNTTKFFPAKCSRIDGSAGEFQSPNRNDNDTVSYFLPDLCRPVDMDRDGPVEIDGINGYRYYGGQRAVDNGTKYPENACYCNGECVPSGVMNISSCWYDASVFMSYPHFYNADPYYVHHIDGMRPQKDKHEFFVVIEPRTGLTLDLAARYQVNLLVEPMKHIRLLHNVPKVFFPLFWFEEKTRITPRLAMEMRFILALGFYGRVFGAVCAFIALILLLWHPLKRRFTRRRMLHIEISDVQNVNQQLPVHHQHMASKEMCLSIQPIASPERSPLLERTKESIRRLLPEVIISTDAERCGVIDNDLETETETETETTSESASTNSQRSCDTLNTPL